MAGTYETVKEGTGAYRVKRVGSGSGEGYVGGVYTTKGQAD